jgi:ribosomal protein L9
MHIKKFLEEHNIFVTKEDIALNEPIKIAGEHIVEINLGLNIKANLKVIVEEKKII